METAVSRPAYTGGTDNLTECILVFVSFLMVRRHLRQLNYFCPRAAESMFSIGFIMSASEPMASLSLSSRDFGGSCCITMLASRILGKMGGALLFMCMQYGPSRELQGRGSLVVEHNPITRYNNSEILPNYVWYIRMSSTWYDEEDEHRESQHTVGPRPYHNT